MKKPVILIILIMTSLTFGQADQKKLKLHKDPTAMKQEIARQIPIGSSLENAKRILEANGFKCRLKERSSFLEMKDDKFIGEHTNLDFLSCEKSKDLLITTHLWQVAIVHKNGVVSDIFDSTAKTPVLQKKDYIHMSDAEIRSVLLKYALVGISEVGVKNVLSEVFHRGFKRSKYGIANAPYVCPVEIGDYTMEGRLQNYDYLRNFFLSIFYVESYWLFDKKGFLKDVQVIHSWDGV